MLPGATRSLRLSAKSRRSEAAHEKLHTTDVFSSSAVLSAGRDGRQTNPRRGQRAVHDTLATVGILHGGSVEPATPPSSNGSRGGRRQVELWPEQREAVSDTLLLHQYSSHGRRNPSTHTLQKKEKNTPPQRSSVIILSRLAGSMLGK